ncbi:MAG: hypothetical protein IT428_07010 [Planctomycetaceae bacterium]|nr:hypothetical protein [Planctomycetaceae bacterium]
MAEKVTGGLSITEKMPCPSWGIPATRCRLGALLAKKEGTVCGDCYALKGRYRFDKVQAKLEERYKGLFDPLWTPAMVHLIRWCCDRYFRWFDSGDVQGENHLQNIVTIAEAVPDVQMWLPTREAETVRKVGEFPPNLTIRLSANKIDGKAPDWPMTSVVRRAGGEGYACPSRTQGNSCRACRACWDRDVENVVYTLH